MKLTSEQIKVLQKIHNGCNAHHNRKWRASIFNRNTIKSLVAKGLVELHEAKEEDFCRLTFIRAGSELAEITQNGVEFIRKQRGDLNA